MLSVKEAARLRLVHFFLIFLLCPAIPIDMATAVSLNDCPFAIIRASLNRTGMWEIHQFSLLPDDGPPASIQVPAGAQGLECFVLEYALFRARFTLGFEGALREGLASEFKRREEIKNATNLGAILYCLPLWPIHLFWELPFTGIEKEQMLELEGYTLQLPVVETSFSGEKPLTMLKAPAQGEGMSQVYDIEPLIVGGNVVENWHGAGLYLSYYLPLADFPADSRVITIGDLLPGYPEDSLGTVLFLIDIPPKSGCNIQIGKIDPPLAFSLWPGNYDWPLGNATYVFSGDRAYVGIRRTKMHRADTISFNVGPGIESSGNIGKGEFNRLTTNWPPAGTFIGKFPFLATVVPPAIVAFLLFHIVNFFSMRVNYRKNPLGAIFDPIISHIILLALAVIFAPFFGLGWIVGAYVAGRFLGWRHPEVRRPWLSMLAYALLAACVYEALFTRTLWL